MIIEGFYQTTIDRHQITTRPSKANNNRQLGRITEPATTSLTTLNQSYRLLCSRHRVNPDQLREQREYDIAQQLEFVSTVSIDGCDKIIAVSYLRADPHKEYCELSVSVASQWKQQGLAEILCKKMLEFARQRGMNFIYSDSDRQAQQLVVNSGLELLPDTYNEPRDLNTAPLTFQRRPTFCIINNGLEVHTPSKPDDARLLRKA